MPVLEGSVAQHAEESADGQWKDPIGSLLPEGWYIASLMEVKDIGGDNKRWDWVFTDFREFDMATEEIGAGRAGRTWWTTTDTPDSVSKVKATFHAFDATLDTNTDELLGEQVIVYLDQHVANQGKMKGKTVNGMSAIRPLPASLVPSEGEGARAI